MNSTEPTIAADYIKSVDFLKQALIGLAELITLTKVPEEIITKDELFEDALDILMNQHGPFGFCRLDETTIVNFQNSTLQPLLDKTINEAVDAFKHRSKLSPEERLLQAIFGPPNRSKEA
jgi:hypothetical protein